MNHLGPEAAAPLADHERAHISRARQNEEFCAMPAPDDAGAPSIRHEGREPDQSYAYRDPNGNLLGYVMRWNAHNGGDKEIRPVTYWQNAKGKGLWKARSWPTPRPLYGLERLARHPNAIVLLVEGEKAAEAVEFGPLAEAFTWGKTEVVGMTWSGGTNAIAHADFAPLAGREVVIVPDHDQPGEKAGDELGETLQRVGVKRLRRWKAPAEAPPKWDIADGLPHGYTPEALVKSIMDAPDITSPRIVLTLPEFLAGYQPPDYLVEGLLQHHYIYSLTGMTGAGKTAVALLIAALVANRNGGQKLGPYEVEHGRVVYIARENPTDVRMRLIGMNVDPDNLDLLVIEQLDTLDKDMPRITREIEAFGDVALVVVDTSPAVFQGDNENDNMQMRDHAKRLRKLCDLPGRPCVLALCHPVKNASTPESLLPRGGGSFIAEMDGNLTLHAHDDRLADLHWTGKFRGPDFDKMTFRMTTVHSTRLVDRKGRLLPTVAAHIVTDDEAAEAEAQGLFQDDRLMVAMLNRPTGTLTEWAADCLWFVRGDRTKPNKKLAYRVAERLKSDKMVAKEGRSLVLTKPGKAAAKKAKETLSPTVPEA